MAEVELAAGVSASEPHAVSVMASVAAQATNTAEADLRDEFTAVTVPRVMLIDCAPVWCLRFGTGWRTCVID
ncbi:hypothetical protein [Mycolicibacterium komossense]|uniref:Uncharacterized protein n=1 Tax=Mycolicibacterium komossense TaxID=1779 RepID=A0ABT3CAR8_9MYCO|nr:hypothetical protein [Mycolicibacterium komossense]MCV7226575.1 hypothetical protein [Mycolicibacterium komossense]